MRHASIAAAALLFVVLVACGGDDDDDVGADASGAAEGTSSPAASTGDSGDGPDGGFCAPESVGDIFDGLDVAALGRADLEDQADVVREALARWADSAPGEIRDDVEVLAATVSDLYELLEEHEYDFSALGPDAADDSRFVALGSARFNEAAANFERYCGFDLQRPSVAPPQGTSSGGPVILDGELRVQDPGEVES